MHDTLCDCGATYSEEEFQAHMDDGRHRRAFKVATCGACFFNLCLRCEGRRGGTWLCRCSHQFRGKGTVLTNHADDEDAPIVLKQLADSWLGFLKAGAPDGRNA